MKGIKYIFSVLCMVIAIPTALRAQGGGWTVNPYDYAYDMTLYAGLMLEEGMVTDYTDYEIAAFVGDECRGVAEVQTQSGRTWLYMRIRSNNNSEETVTFKLYNKSKEKVYDVYETISFASQDRVGMPSSPYQLHLIYKVSVKSANEDMGRVEMDGSGLLVGGTTQRVVAMPETGYVFVRWTQDGVPVSTENPYVFTVFKDASLVASFKLGRYNVTFDVDGVASTESMLYGTVIPTPDEPTKEGHTFAGWLPEFETGATVPANDITYAAQWTVNQYTITFDTDGGSEVKAITQDFGSKVTAPAAPTKEGYTFNGWDTEVPATMPAGNVTIKAQWTVNKYEVFFMVDGEEYSRAIVEFGDEIILPANPAKEGYTFLGWGDVPKTMPSKDILLSASFSINKYLVTFVVDGEVLLADSLEYGVQIEAPNVPDREGYSFDGWNNLDETVPAHDVTYVGSYNVNTYKVFYYVGDKLIHTEEVAYGAEIPEYTYEPAESGEVFNGWIGEHYDTMPAHDVTYVADIATSIRSLLESGKSVVIYDLRGRRIHDASKLGSGVYIINGRKVTVVR